MVCQDILIEPAALQLGCQLSRYRLPHVGKSPEVSSIVDCLNVRPVLGNVFRVSVILIQNNIDNCLLTNLFVDLIPFISSLVLFLNGFQSSSRGIGSAPGLNVEGSVIVIQKNLLHKLRTFRDLLHLAYILDIPYLENTL